MRLKIAMKKEYLVNAFSPNIKLRLLKLDLYQTSYPNQNSFHVNWGIDAGRK